MVWLRYSSLTLTSNSPRCLQSIVICLMISSKHWSNSYYRIGHSPIYRACLCSNLFYSYSCSWMTYILVAGVESTVCTHSWPLSVRCYLGGSISPKISSVWCTSSYFCAFLEWPSLLTPLTRTGVENLTSEICYPNILGNVTSKL